MKIETLPGDPGARQKRKRVGRGESSGQGKTCGRGHKGAQSRAGFSRRFGYEGGQMPLHRRIPKRGFFNRFRTHYETVDVARLECFEDGAVVDYVALRERRLVQKKGLPIKILGQSELTKKLIVEADRFTGGARRAIEAGGGECRQRDRKAQSSESQHSDTREQDTSGE